MARPISLNCSRSLARQEVKRASKFPVLSLSHVLFKLRSQFQHALFKSVTAKIVYVLRGLVKSSNCYSHNMQCSLSCRHALFLLATLCEPLRRHRHRCPLGAWRRNGWQRNAKPLRKLSEPSCATTKCKMRLRRCMSQLMQLLLMLLQSGPPLTKQHSVMYESENRFTANMELCNPRHPRIWNLKQRT